MEIAFVTLKTTQKQCKLTPNRQIIDVHLVPVVVLDSIHKCLV